MKRVTVKSTPIYVIPGDTTTRVSIGAGNKLTLLAYTGGKYALVKNPKTGREFIVEYESLKEA